MPQVVRPPRVCRCEPLGVAQRDARGVVELRSHQDRAELAVLASEIRIRRLPLAAPEVTRAYPIRDLRPHRGRGTREIGQGQRLDRAIVFHRCGDGRGCLRLLLTSAAPAEQGHGGRE